MGWTKEVWRSQVARNLLELSSIEFQRDLWLAKLPGFQSDFSEVICRLDGCGIPEYLDDFLEKDFLDNETAEKTKTFRLAD